MSSTSGRLYHQTKELEGLHTQVFVEGDPKHTTVLLIHGATVAAWEFNQLVEASLTRGFHCIRYDLFGHGLSSKPYKKLNRALLINQACDIVDQYCTRQPFILLGHSLGGAIASQLAVARKEQVERLILLAPMLNFVRTSFIARLLSRPSLGKIFMQVIGRHYLRQRRHKRLNAMGLPELKIQFDEAYYSEGYWQSMQALFQSGALGCQHSTYLKLGQERLMTQILWGKLDTVIPEAHIVAIDKLLEVNPFHQKALYLSHSEHNFVLTQAGRICQLVFSENAGI